MKSSARIIVSQPRDTVRVTLSSGQVLEGPLGTTVEAFLHADRELHPDQYASPIIAGVFDAKLRELSYSVKRDGTLQPVLLSTSDGGRIYRRSLILLLVTAVEELFPNVKVSVSYAVPDGGMFCILRNREPFTADEVTRVEAHMREIVAADDPINKKMVTLEEAVALFRERGDDDKLRLLESRTRNGLILYTLRSRSDYYYGYMLPSTGILETFRLLPTERGFVLQYPRQGSPNALQPMKTYIKVNQVFQEAEDWLTKMNLQDVGTLNRLVREDRVQELILVAEALHEQSIAYIARTISDRLRDQGMRIVLIAGPSSSGKTTFSKRLSIQLLAHGLRPFTLEMDNYFVDREKTPRDEEGNYDFEALETLNLPLLNEQFAALIAGQKIISPRFDFLTGKSQPDRPSQLRDNQIIIAEGIHGLNPRLLTEVPPEKIYRIYVSALTQLNIDFHNRVPTTDVRLLRRIARDAARRGYSATDTIQRWESVRRGEKKNIFPFQENADVMFNSALAYELAALRPLVEPLLLQVEPGTPPHIEANRLLSFLRWVQPFTETQEARIPDTSLLREFIGGSILDTYHPDAQDF